MGRKHIPINGSSRWVEALGVVLRSIPLLLSSALMATALGPQRLPWLGLLSLLPLLRSIQVSSPGRALLGGALWGSGVFLFGVAFGAVELSWLAAALLLSVPALYAGVGARITRRVGFSPFVLGVGWVLVEVALRPLALQHGLVATTQGAGLVAAVGGALGYAWVGFLVVYLAAWLLELLSRLQVAVSLPPVRLSLDAAERFLCMYVGRCRPCYVPCASHPRAPPRR